MPRFAANLGYLFTDRALLERIDAAAAAGFKAIELQFPYDVPAAAGEGRDRAQQAHHARRQHAAGRARRRVRPGRRARPREGLGRRCLPARSTTSPRSAAARCIAWPARSRPSSARRPSASSSTICKRAADLAAAKNITLLIEPINPRDRPNYFLNHVEHAADIIAKAGRPNITHAVRFLSCADRRRRSDHAGWKNTCRSSAICNARRCRSRHEPDEGEINYPVRVRGGRPARLPGWIGCRIPAARAHRGRLGLGRPIWRDCRPLTAD